MTADDSRSQTARRGRQGGHICPSRLTHAARTYLATVVSEVDWLKVFCVSAPLYFCS